MSVSRKAYDVFISFHGEETRTNFTSFLSYTLRQNSINVYIDDDNLEKGEDVCPVLFKAIKDSHVAVVVFSKNYASSKWCLEELVKIVQCRKEEGQVVIPVFLEVDPSEIRNQTGTIGEAFIKHERALVDNDNEDFRKKLSEWRAALNEVANISGLDTRSNEYKTHSEVINKVVEDVMQKLKVRIPDEPALRD